MASFGGSWRNHHRREREGRIRRERNSDFDDYVDFMNTYGHLLNDGQDYKPDKPFPQKRHPGKSMIPKGLGKAAGKFTRAYGFAYAITEWAKWGPGNDNDYDLTGWTVQCNTNYAAGETHRGIGMSPAQPGWPSVSGCTCGVGCSNSINWNWGAPIPAGTTFVQRGGRNTPYVRGAPAPEGTRNMDIRKRHTFPGGSPSPIPLTSNKPGRPLPTVTEYRSEDREKEYGRNDFERRTYGYNRRQRFGRTWRRGKSWWDNPGEKGKIPPHKEIPPPPGDNEVKVKVPYGALGRLYGGLTEFKDALDCMSKAQDEWRRYGRLWTRVKDPCKGLPLHAKALCVFQHLDRTDWVAAVECFAQNQLTDKVIGKLSSKVDDNIRKSPYASERPGGYGRGGGSWALRMR